MRPALDTSRFPRVAPGTPSPVAKEVTMSTRLDEYEAYRLRMNERILGADHLGIKRFFNLDTSAYKDGALPAKTKELLGLVTSAVLRCNDCIDYHLIQCVEAGFDDEELYEALNVALVVGGSIVIPHLRHAFETIDLLRNKESD
jgi:AhpD family alkylhydroperoxidase